MEALLNVISLLGGLAMFLYGMRIMGDGLKESSSGTLRRAMEKLTNTRIKAFLLGLCLTALIQSSTATIVITSGLVGAGIISLRQSLGIVVGANVGTTVTGQIIRLLDVDAEGTSFLQFFKPNTLAPIALIIGIVIIMTKKSKGPDKIGRIVIGFGILFTGLMAMTDSVSSLTTEGGIIEQLFTKLGDAPLIGYAIGAGVAFLLQSSSATIGILQAFSVSGTLTFAGIYPVLVGIYLGDCVTTAIVCNIGAKPDAKRVGIVNILFNLSETVIIFIGVNVVHALGLIDGLWGLVLNSGGIANTNTVFNLTCAILLLPIIGVYEKISYKIIKDKPVSTGVTSERSSELIAALNPVFLKTPAIAFARCYEALLEMLVTARSNIGRAFDLVEHFDEKSLEQLLKNEDDIDILEDRVSNYLVQISSSINSPEHVEILNQYYTVVTEFERLGDHAVNISEVAERLNKNGTEFTPGALAELRVLRQLIENVLEYCDEAFRHRNLEASRHIEPLEEVVDDMINALKSDHLERLRQGRCTIFAGTEFLNLITDVERISDICSNVGVATVARIKPELKHQVHDYVSVLHSGRDEDFNAEYEKAHDKYFSLLNGETNE